MSVIRWGEQGSSVYVIMNAEMGDAWQCVACEWPDRVTKDTEAFRLHLLAHRNRGDVVPPKALELEGAS